MPLAPERGWFNCRSFLGKGKENLRLAMITSGLAVSKLGANKALQKQLLS